MQIGFLPLIVVLALTLSCGQKDKKDGAQAPTPQWQLLKIVPIDQAKDQPGYSLLSSLGCEKFPLSLAIFDTEAACLAKFTSESLDPSVHSCGKTDRVINASQELDCSKGE